MGALQVRAGNYYNSFMLLQAKQLPLESVWSTSVHEPQTHVNVHQLIGAAPVRGFKSTVISPAISNQRRQRRRTDYFIYVFSFPSIWLCPLLHMVPALIPSITSVTFEDAFWSHVATVQHATPTKLSGLFEQSGEINWWNLPLSTYWRNWIGKHMKKKTATACIRGEHYVPV